MGASLMRAALLYLCLACLFWGHSSSTQLPGQIHSRRDVIDRSSQANLSITAFEYQRKFNNVLDLGECPQRDVTYRTNNSMHFQTEKCGIPPRQGTKLHLDRKLYDPRNVLITSPEQITNYFTLCGGEAAAFLGILNNHEDCLAVEIASRLTFNEKTVIRLFVGYYRKSVDKLDVADRDKNKERYHIVRDKMYLESRSIGTTEVIFAQFRFKSARHAKEAAKIDMDSPSMSEYMKEIEDKVGVPKHTTLMYMSTAQRLFKARDQEPYEMKKFPSKDWLRAVRMAKTSENEIRATIEQINQGSISPHLTYTLRPWDPRAGTITGRSFRKEWENVSILEVQLRQTFNHVKKTARRCRGNRKKHCNRVREIKRKLSRARQEIHDGRSRWHVMAEAEKTKFVRNFTTQVTRLDNLGKHSVKAARKYLKKMKLDRYYEEEKKGNMIPTVASPYPPNVKPNKRVDRLKPNKTRPNRKSTSRKNRKSKSRSKKRRGRKQSRNQTVTKAPRSNRDKSGRIYNRLVTSLPLPNSRRPNFRPIVRRLTRRPRLPIISPYKTRPLPRVRLPVRSKEPAHPVRHARRKVAENRVLRPTPHPRHVRRKFVDSRNG